MKKLLIIALVAVCVAVPAVAQTVAYHDTPSASTGSTNTFPFGNAFGNNWRYQITVPASSLPKQACRFVELAFAPTTTGTFQVKDFNLRMAHTTSLTLTTIFANNYASTPVDMINVQGTGYSFTVKTAPKWTPLGVTTPFDWDGKRHLLIEVRYRGFGTNNQGTTNSIRCYTSSTNSNRIWCNGSYPSPPVKDPYASTYSHGSYTSGAMRVALSYVTIALTLSGSRAPGGTADLNLSAASDASKPYQVASSLGVGPTPIGTRSLGLTLDELMKVTVNNYLPGIFVNYGGKLDVAGLGKAQIKIPNDSRLKGVQIYSAFITLDPKAPFGVANISNTVTLSIT